MSRHEATEVLDRYPLRPRRRAGWALLDQVVVSARNFLLLWVVIREFPVADVGAFGIVYTTYFMAMALVRGLAGDPLVVRFTGASAHDGAAAAAGSLGAALMSCGVISALLILPLSLADGPVWVGLAALGVSLPALLTQDHLRLIAFARGRPDRATLNDTLVLLVLILGLASLVLFSQLDIAIVVITWGAASLAGTAAGVVSKDLTGWRGARRWLRVHADVGPVFATDAVANRGMEQVTQVLVSVIAGMGTVGIMTASRTLFAPLTTVQTGVNAFVMPEVARRARDRQLNQVPRLVACLAAMLAATMLATGMVVAAVPDRWGKVLFSSNWDAAAAIVWPMAIFSALNAIAFAYWAALKGLGRARSTLVIRAVGGAIGAAGAIAGATQGAAAATWGMALGAGVTAVWLAADLHLTINSEGSLNVDKAST